MKNVLRFLFLISIILLQGCNFWGVRGSGDIEEQTREISEFERVDASGAFTIYVEVGEEPSVEIRADDNLLRYIVTKVRGNKLIIDQKRNLNPRHDIEIRVTTLDLKEIDASGANTIFVRNINSPRFNVDMSGAGTIKLEGNTEELDIELSGAGEISAKNLISRDVNVDISGAASASVYASNSIRAEVSGVGSVYYYGDPEKVKTDISGVGSIQRK